MTIARVENGIVIDTRQIDLMDVPEHKRALWRPVVYEGEGPHSETTIEPARVLIVRSTPVPTQADYAAALQAHVDAAAREKGYADGVALASYITSTVTAWQTEAATFVPWRDNVWAYAYQQMALVQSGQRAQPTVAELIDELPAIVWP